jgi:sugar lactone lactonase YvrE
VQRVDDAPFDRLAPEGPADVRPSGGCSTARSRYADLSELGDGPFNEIVVDGRGNAYVNGGGGFDGPSIVALVTPDGRRRVAGGLDFPNRMAIADDGATLIVAESSRCLTAFEIEPDGSLANRRVWADLATAPDGICVDAEARSGTPTPHKLRARARGRRGARDRPADRGCFACMLGGDGRTLFVVACSGSGWSGCSTDRRPALWRPRRRRHAGRP